MSPALDQTPLHAPHYADGADVVLARIVDNVAVARSTYRLRFEAPTIAATIAPGQFVMVRLAGCDDPLLGRAFALYDCDQQAGWVEVVYLVHGKFTTALATRQPGDRVEVWGPLGNGFIGEGGKEAGLEHLILVAGGIGQTPFLATAKEAFGHQTYGDPHRRSRLGAEKVTLAYGVRTADYVAGESDFRAAGIDLRLASDDGTIGHHGLVTDLLSEVLDETEGHSRKVLCCGPERMMQAVAQRCLAAGVRCDISLETPMACGLGICFSCVAKVKQADGSWDYKRTCVEGPVFDAAKIVWE